MQFADRFVIGRLTTYELNDMSHIHSNFDFQNSKWHETTTQFTQSVQSHFH